MNRFKTLATGCVAGSFALMSIAAGAQTGTAGHWGAAGTTAQARQQQGTQIDRDFVKKAAEDSLAEVELGRLAADRAHSPELKQFAQRLVDAHSKALDQLKQIAQRNDVEVPEALNEEHQELKQRLSGLSGDAFDRQYVEAIVKAHQKAEDMLEDRVGEEGRPGRTVGTSGETSAGTGHQGTEGAVGGTTTGTRSVRPGASGADNAALDQWARNTLQHVREHLQRAKELDRQIDK